MAPSPTASRLNVRWKTPVVVMGCRSVSAWVHALYGRNPRGIFYQCREALVTVE